MTGTRQLIGPIHRLLALLWQILNLGRPVPTNSTEKKPLLRTITGSGITLRRPHPRPRRSSATYEVYPPPAAPTSTSWLFCDLRGLSPPGRSPRTRTLVPGRARSSPPRPAGYKPAPVRHSSHGIPAVVSGAPSDIADPPRPNSQPRRPWRPNVSAWQPFITRELFAYARFNRKGSV